MKCTLRIIMKRRTKQNGIQIWERCYSSPTFTHCDYRDHYYILVSKVEQTIRNKTFYRFFLLLDQYVHYTNLLPWYIRRRLSAIASHWIFIDFIIPVEQRKIPSIQNESKSFRAFHSNVPVDSRIYWIDSLSHFSTC